VVNRIIHFSFLVICNILFSCGNYSPTNKEATGNDSLITDRSGRINKPENLIKDLDPLFRDGDVNAVVEIPAGTIEKWEIDTFDGKLKLEIIDTKPRIVNYLGYPGNYGMIPGTLLPTEKGGDGDPLDVIILGPPVERGSSVKCKVIGILYLFDRGEQDDKVIAVSANTPLYEVDDMDELNEYYNGIDEILELWFINYKGPGKIISNGFGSRKNAMRVLEIAIAEYRLSEGNFRR